MGDAWDDLDAPRVQPRGAGSAEAPPPGTGGGSTGLWRHSGQAHGEEASKCRIIAFIVAVLCGYGMAMLVNGAASRLLTPRFMVGPGASPLTGTKLVVVGADPVFLLSSFRVLATLCLLAAMFVVGDVPSELRAARSRVLSCVWAGGAKAPSPSPPAPLPSPTSTSTSTSTSGQDEDWAASPPPTPVAVGAPLKSSSSSSSSTSSSSGLTPALIAVPVAIGATNALGYLPYMVLCNMDGVALWSALVGLYVVIPVSYGVFVRGEARTRKKVIGIAACVVSGILLGLPAGGEGNDAAAAAAAAEEGGSPGWVKLVLFVATIGIWGACDGMVAFVGRDLHQFYVAAFTAVGFGLAALVASWVAFVATAMAGTNPLEGAAAVARNATAAAGGSPLPSSHTPTDSVGEGGAAGYALLFAAQAAGICAWYASVRLGQMSEASAFLPITALYTLLTSVGGVTLLGETLPSMGWAGIALAAVGMLLIATA